MTPAEQDRTQRLRQLAPREVEALLAIGGRVPPDVMARYVAWRQQNRNWAEREWVGVRPQSREGQVA